MERSGGRERDLRMIRRHPFLGKKVEGGCYLGEEEKKKKKKKKGFCVEIEEDPVRDAVCLLLLSKKTSQICCHE